MADGVQAVVPRRTKSSRHLPPESLSAMAGRRRGRPRRDEEHIGDGVKMAMRDYIRTLATEQFGLSGFHAVSIESVLRGTGISKPTLYRQFYSKNGLITACVVEDSERVARRIDDSGWRHAVDLEPRVRAIVRVLAQEVLDERRRGLLAGKAALEFRDVGGMVRDAAERGLGIVTTCLVDAFEPLLGCKANGFAERVLMLVHGAGVCSVCSDAHLTAGTLEEAAVEIAQALVAGPAAGA